MALRDNHDQAQYEQNDLDNAEALGNSPGNVGRLYYRPDGIGRGVCYIVVFRVLVVVSGRKHQADGADPQEE